jgi:hypothetical protein
MEIIEVYTKEEDKLVSRHEKERKERNRTHLYPP